LMSTGTASGENKAEEAVRKALDSPLLNDNKITGAKNVLLLIRSGAEEVTMDEIGIIMDHIQKEAGHTADIIFGVGADDELGDAVSVLVIATGFSNDDKKFAGPTEKIRIGLNDRLESQKSSPFKTREEREVSPEQGYDFGGKNLFRLDDEDQDTPQFKSVSTEKKMIIADEEIKTEIKFSDREEDTLDSPIQNWRDEEEQDAYSLFAFDEDNDPNDLEIQSFSFETEEKKEEPKTSFTNSYSEEKPVEFSFFVNEPTSNELKTDYGQPKAEFSAPTNTLSQITEEAPKMESFYQPKEEIKTEERPTFEHKTEIETTQTSDSEFTFVNKTADQERVIERRNKLKEFNSRYQSFDSASEFESVPAFKRKNISIDGTNASDQNINTYLSENNGSMQVRENRFLNKDVD